MAIFLSNATWAFNNMAHDFCRVIKLKVADMVILVCFSVLSRRSVKAFLEKLIVLKV